MAGCGKSETTDDSENKILAYLPTDKGQKLVIEAIMKKCENNIW